MKRPNHTHLLKEQKGGLFVTSEGLENRVEIYLQAQNVRSEERGVEEQKGNEIVFQTSRQRRQVALRVLDRLHEMESL